MNIADTWAQIEDDYSWRVDEIRFFENQLTIYPSENDREKLRRALVLLLYSHFEGFCKFSLLLYVANINSQNLKCSEVNSAIVASSLHKMFLELRNPNSKSDIFKNSLPDDTKLHRFARDKEFVDNPINLLNAKLRIPEDVVDTDSNLKPSVLRKNLFQLGFPHDLFKGIEGRIDTLLKFRNKIAHGENKSGISQSHYKIVKTASDMIMREIKQKVMAGLTYKNYLREDSSDYDTFMCMIKNDI